VGEHCISEILHEVCVYHILCDHVVHDDSFPHGAVGGVVVHDGHDDDGVHGDDRGVDNVVHDGGGVVHDGDDGVLVHDADYVCAAHGGGGDIGVAVHDADNIGVVHDDGDDGVVVHDAGDDDDDVVHGGDSAVDVQADDSAVDDVVHDDNDADFVACGDALVVVEHVDAENHDVDESDDHAVVQVDAELFDSVAVLNEHIHL
jgi:hypothetical protein